MSDAIDPVLDTYGEQSSVMVQDRRSTRLEKKQIQNHFLTFKEQMKFKQTDSFAQHYKISKQLGAGAFGTVKAGFHRRSKMPCAIKIIKKEKLSEHQIYEELNKNEFEVLETVQHPNITRIFDLMEDKRNYYIVAELMSGGHLMEKLAAAGYKFTESKAASVIHQMLLALKFMHGKNIMHRDLKPENILCELASDMAPDELVIKLTDFGFAVKYNPNRKESLSLGSPLYMAPELCKETQYDFKVDCWAVGVIAYILLSGSPPFYDKSRR